MLTGNSEVGTLGSVEPFKPYMPRQNEFRNRPTGEWAFFIYNLVESTAKVKGAFPMDGGFLVEVSITWVSL